ncbi:MAG: sigma-54 dependent transcriptional regulator [Candidatus Krumholzibacteriia bacterium]
MTNDQGPRVLIVDDDPAHRRLYADALQRQGFRPVEAADGAAALALLQRERPALVVSDVRMPGLDGLAMLRQVRECCPELPFLLVTAYPDVREAVTALKLGAVDYLGKPVDLDELTAVCGDIVDFHADVAPGQLPSAAMDGIVAESPALRAVLNDAWRIAASDATVLLTGESGTGKDVVAHFVHRLSGRSRRPLVAVNCAALPEGLVASELFGHEPGAFTGAVGRRPGRFREADGGTLFLDEIGDMPLDLQPALLRVLETGRLTPVGGTGEQVVDVRLVAATNRDLDAAVRGGRFREDLFHRLNVIALEVPPLRHRPEDILPLCRRFLHREEVAAKRLSPAAARALQAYSWPGNVRELANAMERARLLSRTDVVLPEHLPPAVRQGAAAAPVAAGETATVVPLDRLERQTIEQALTQTGGNRTRAAELLGISRRTLIYKLKRYRQE